MAHHGNTPAAWTGVLVILVGFVVGGIGQLPMTRPMPPTTKPTRMTRTPVHAAGVLPW